VNWNSFIDILATLRSPHDPSHGGRPPFDALLMFKILVLKSLYNLSDENMELFIRDRLSLLARDKRNLWDVRSGN
jgi:hypothetical protein